MRGERESEIDGEALPNPIANRHHRRFCERERERELVTAERERSDGGKGERIHVWGRKKKRSMCEEGAATVEPVVAADEEIVGATVATRMTCQTWEPRCRSLESAATICCHKCTAVRGRKP